MVGKKSEIKLLDNSAKKIDDVMKSSEDIKSKVKFSPDKKTRLQSAIAVMMDNFVEFFKSFIHKSRKQVQESMKESTARGVSDFLLNRADLNKEVRHEIANVRSENISILKNR